LSDARIIRTGKNDIRIIFNKVGNSLTIHGGKKARKEEKDIA